MTVVISAADFNIVALSRFINENIFCRSDLPKSAINDLRKLALRYSMDSSFVYLSIIYAKMPLHPNIDTRQRYLKKKDPFAMFGRNA
jgi:hypothetical protein